MIIINDFHNPVAHFELNGYLSDPLVFRDKARCDGGGGLSYESSSCILALRLVFEDGGSLDGEYEQGFGGITGVAATPNRKYICVIFDGQGYWISTEDPNSYEVIPCLPIKHVYSEPVTKQLVFVDCVGVCCYGINGLAWNAESISWDGIEILQVNDREIIGNAWDAPTDRDVAFSIDIVTGKVSGGAYQDGQRP